MTDRLAPVIELHPRHSQPPMIEVPAWVTARSDPSFEGDDLDLQQYFSDHIIDHVCPDLFDAEAVLDAEPVDRLPYVFTADQLSTEKFDRFRAERLIRGIGGTGMAAIVERRKLKDEQTLLSNGKAAAAGDPVADERVMASCWTDLGERAFKSGLIAPITLEEDETGIIHQNGLPMETVASNTLRYAARHPVMRDIAGIEALNIFRIETANRMDLFDDYVLVMESAVSDELTPEEAKKQNFFVPTMTLSIQVIEKEKGSKTLTNSSILVAGVVQPGAERHDIDGLDSVGDSVGLNRRGLSTLQRLEGAYFVHKSLLPNGKIDLLMAYDKPGGTFFGQKHDGPAPTIEDYQKKIEEGQKLLDGLEDTALRVKQRFLKDVVGLTEPRQAIARLDRISHEELLSRTFTDETIEPMVFGAAASPYIVAARQYQKEGDYAGVQASMGMAQALAHSIACQGEIGVDVKDENDAGDGKGPLKFKCLNGHDCVRPLNDYLKECTDCKKEGKDGKASVGCK